MSGIRRFMSIIFVLAGAASIAALGLVWQGPYQAQATKLLTTNQFYFYTIEVCVAILALGLLIVLIRAIFTPKQAESIVVGNIDGDKITITRSAVASQATHIIDDDGDCRVKSVKVKAKTKGHIKVFIRVIPLETVDVITKSVELHDKLSEGLSVLCGDEVEKIDLEFLESDSYADVSHDASIDVDSYLASIDTDTQEVEV